MNISGIYQIQSKIKPRRFYIGSAINIQNRWWIHLCNLRKNKHDNKKLQNHYNKYGESDLQFSILLGCSREDLINHEQFFIDSLKPWFNIRLKVESNIGTKWSEESRLNFTGRKLSDEHKQKLSKSAINRKRKPWSEEAKQKMRHPHKKGQIPWCTGLTKESDERILNCSKKHSEFMKGKKYAYGYHHSEKIKQQISQRSLNNKYGCGNKGQIPWNKGLTKETDNRVKKTYSRFARI